MLNINRLSMKNFFSFGNAPQVLELNTDEITLVLGQNNDAQTDDDSGERRNGVGKSSIIQGLVFGLYGKSIGNNIKISNLVNKTNAKHCEIEIDFTKDDISYRVERGRNPTYFNFYVIDINGKKIDDSRGEKKDTQEDLEEILGISQLLFEYIVVMNANVEPFLALSQQKQREFIEELLGITQLTEKAEILKEMCKENIKKAQNEKFRLETIQESNVSIQKSISVLEDQAQNFDKTKNERIRQYKSDLEMYIGVDFEALEEDALIAEKAKVHNSNRVHLENRVNDLSSKCLNAESTIEEQKSKNQTELNDLLNFNIEEELVKHSLIEEIQAQERTMSDIQHSIRLIESKISSNESSINSNVILLEAETEKLKALDNNECPMCSSSLPCDDLSLKEKVLSTIKSLENSIIELVNTNDELLEQKNTYILPVIQEKPSTKYRTVHEAKMHKQRISDLSDILQKGFDNIYIDELESAIADLDAHEVMVYEETFSLLEVQTMKMDFNSISQNLERENAMINPYWEQIDTLKSNSIKEVDYTEYNNLNHLAEHQDFLVKLLMNKDSFVRKRIIDQNIQYLNSRLQYYIEKVDSQQGVVFMNDLSVDINLRERSYDFKQLSRGERTRVVIALNLAFRDVHEATRGPINLLVNDEIFEDGLDPHGVNTMWNIFKDYGTRHNKSVYIVSHREEVRQRAKMFLMITKEDEFSSMEVLNSLEM